MFSSSSSVGTLFGALVLSASIVQAYPTVYDFDTTQLIKRDTLADCLSAAGVVTSLPSSSNWTVNTESWNSRINPVPAVVVFPSTEADITAALKCATTSKTKVTTLGGNRSFQSQAWGRTDGAMIVNLVNMKVLTYDEATKILTYGGPVMISEVANYLWKNFKRTLPHGRCPDVGMTGVAASGFGTLSRKAGSILDNIVGARVALADGTIVDCSADENTDLFWAIRGAAPSFGVVITFKINTIDPPSDTVHNYTITFPSTKIPTQQEATDALIGTQKWALSKDNNDLLSIRFSLAKNPKLEGFFYGTDAEFATVSEALLSYLPNMTIASESHDFWESEDINTPGLHAMTLTGRRFFYIVSVTIPSSAPLTNATAYQLFTSTAFATKPADVGSTGGFVDIWGGAYAKTVPADLSAWKHDDNLLLVRHDMRSKTFDVAFSNASLQTIRKNFYTFVDAYKADGGTPGGFNTYRDAEWDADETAEYLYGSTGYAKLRTLKTKYDAGELFNTDVQSVPAAA